MLVVVICSAAFFRVRWRWFVFLRFIFIQKLYDYFDAQIFQLKCNSLVMLNGFARKKREENKKIIVIVGLDGFIEGAKYNTIPPVYFGTSIDHFRANGHLFDVLYLILFNLLPVRRKKKFRNSYKIIITIYWHTNWKLKVLFSVCSLLLFCFSFSLSFENVQTGFFSVPPFEWMINKL